MGKWSQIAQSQQGNQSESKWRQLAQPQQSNLTQEQNYELPMGEGFVETLLKEQPEESYVKETIKNIPKSAVDYASDMIGPITHPKQTAEAMVNLALGVVEKFPGGRYLTVGPEYDLPESPNKRSAAVNSTMEYFSGRYGSWDGFKEAVKNDPVGVTADLASVLSGSGSAIKGVENVSKINSLKKAGETLSKTGAFVDPLGAISAFGQASVRKIIPEKSASRLYEGAAKFSTTLNTKQRSKLIKTALDKQIMPTFNGLVKVGKQIEDLNFEISQVINEAANTGQKISVGRLTRGFQELKKNSRFSGQPQKAQRAVKNIRKEIVETNTIYFDGEPVGMKSFTPKEAQKLKQNIYKELESYYSRVTNNPVSVKAQKLIARNAKEAIEKIVPEIKQLNKNDGDLLALRKEIDKVAPRIANRDLLSLGTTAKAAGGGVVFGKTGILLGLSLGLLDSQPIIKARLALIIHKLKTRGIKVNQTAALARLTSYQTGAITEEIQENAPKDF